MRRARPGSNRHFVETYPYRADPPMPLPPAGGDGLAEGLEVDRPGEEAVGAGGEDSLPGLLRGAPARRDEREATPDYGTPDRTRGRECGAGSPIRDAPDPTIPKL